MKPGAKFKRGQVEVFGHPIEYAEAGSGDVIVSFPGSAGLEMSTAKDMLAEEFRVIEVNPPGWGASPALTGAIKQRDLALILATAVEEIGVGRYHLIGTSMGGLNAFWAAYFRPSQVRSMVLEGPMLFYTPEHLVNPQGPPPAHLIRQGVISYDSTAYPAPPPHPRKPWATAEFFHEQMTWRFKNFAYMDYQVDETPLVEFARTMTIPTTLVLGDRDEILKLNYADRFKVMIPNSTVKIVEGATHDVQNTAPEAFVAAVRETIGR